MEILGSVTSAGNQPELPLSSTESSASPVESESGTQPLRGRRKVRKYKLKKSLTAEQVETVRKFLDLSVDDFEEVKEKKKRPEGEPREPHNAAFFVFWNIYPRHDIIGAAMRAWKKLQPDSATVEKILADVKMRCGSWDWQKDGGKWIPFAHTYLANQRWLDEGVVNNEIIKRRTVV